jgi:hypothetical protein
MASHFCDCGSFGWYSDEANCCNDQGLVPVPSKSESFPPVNILLLLLPVASVQNSEKLTVGTTGKLGLIRQY